MRRSWQQRFGRVSNMALVSAVGVPDTGEREALGLDVGPREDGAFWTAFLRGLVVRCLKRWKGFPEAVP